MTAKGFDVIYTVINLAFISHYTVQRYRFVIIIIMMDNQFVYNVIVVNVHDSQTTLFVVLIHCIRETGNRIDFLGFTCITGSF